MDNIIIWLVLIIIVVIGKVVSMIMQKGKKSNINFNEFDDIEKIKQQEIKDKQEMEHESKVLDKVYNDTFINYLLKNKHDDELKGDNIIYDIMKAQLNAYQNTEEAKRHLQNFKVLDAVEVEEESVAEGNQISALRENGYNFNVELFKKWSKQIFECIKFGTKEQLEIVKNFMSEELYDRLEKQMKQFAKDGLEFVTEDLLIEKCNLYDYGKSMSKEEIKILIQASMKEYILHKDTNKILRGNNKKSYSKKIIMTFVKQNKNETEELIHNCPNCGAEVIQTEFVRCRYCNTLVFPIRYNWTLTKFETM